MTANGAFNNPTGNVTSQPYRFEFDTECLGNYYDLSRPPFVWTIKYLTESGRIYEEQLGDYTKGDYSKMMFYLYDRVPTNGTTPTNQAATAASGNGNTFVTTNSGTANTAQPGELIYGIRLECTGYSCNVTDDYDAIDIRYYGRRPDAISLNGAALPLCRNQTYTISNTAVLGASAYTWTASNGAAILGIAANPTSVTLDLSNVPASAISVTLRVAAFDYNNCGGAAGAPRVSDTRDLVVPIQQAPAQPTSLQLDGGRCPSATEKTLRVAAATTSGVTKYRWQLVGSNNPSGTYLLGNTNNQITTANTPTEGTAAVQQIGTPNAGTVTVSVETKTDECGGYGPALTQSFQIGNVALVAPSSYTGPGDWCWTNSNRITIAATPGLQYYPLNFFGDYARNIQPAGAQVTASQAVGGSPDFDISIGTNSAGQFPASFDLYVNVISPCPGGGTASQVYLLPITVGTVRKCGRVGGRSSDADAEKPVGLYPNPTRGVVSIEARPNVRYEWVKVTDSQGRVVEQRHRTTEAGVTTFDLKALPAGLYQVQLFDGQRLSTQRLLKE